MVIQNPTKEVLTKYPLDEVKKALDILDKHAASAALLFKSDPMNFYRYKATGKGLFNMGVFVEVALTPCPEGTKIHVECRRAVGWIDNAAELTDTVEVMIGTITLLGKILTGEKKLT
jgi:hypothetical protein